MYLTAKKKQNQVKTNGAIYLSESTITELDEEESQKATGNKKMKAAFEIETEYSNRKYILCAKSEEERDVSFFKSGFQIGAPNTPLYF